MDYFFLRDKSDRVLRVANVSGDVNELQVPTPKWKGSIIDLSSNALAIFEFHLRSSPIQLMR